MNVVKDPVEIIQDSDVEFFVRLRDKYEDPIDLTDVNAAQACFLKTDGTYFTVSLVPSAAGSKIELITPKTIGKLKFTLKAADDINFATVELETLDIRMTTSTGKVLRGKFYRAFSVLAKKC